MLSGKRIILGVTGGIAAYKAAFLLREFQKAGAEVRVTMTPSATRFVGLETFASLSGHEVAVDIFPDAPGSSDWTRHINWGEWADLYVIAPCTANTLAKITSGISDNMLTSTVLAARCPVLICPTMDGEMYDSPAVSLNLKKVQEFGYHILEPESGYLASGLDGKGRLPEIGDILEKVSEIIGSVKGPLEGKKVVVTAGPTREHIDPVRFISNPSSGKMGIAMAEAAQSLGADVTLIHGPLSVSKPENIHSISITSTADLFDAVKKYADADVVIMAAAVSDFSPTEIHQQKVKKTAGENSIKLKRTQDILAWLGDHKKEGQVLIGFAMETENLIENATSKLKKKNADWIIANSLNDKDAGFEADTNTVHLLGIDSDQKFQGAKKDIAIEILNTIFR
ncbi:MAG: bifunctional phosphopantothenoylcysteine decarboxylase/phosphopantothenate--cysteine ligase CoaBC [Gracilimonas sp.]|uniref:bifunctional phosphopantothenoylcysteine decarboxylase/phosphopantothenate--cysteine ligase CoaBC n=1 Tax=Gracilimonas sp. TaxID=1974203 RepID=UPI00198B41DA|nr:bifunctional phosphopantothenoylcysteine decarboxylase/phosphopantothenate--cysteine ligase CoaBC [Gracilimonas sp.]MBD3616456.1 bifunctional phosphopantothenoylcysteine decarboxylase/phosphopantothenate--cysteine ligase CoaBC [Gracilimonas sp.]